jgi:hypothetical protein
MIRLAVFLAALSSWYGTAVVFWGKEATTYIHFFGSLYAVPTAVYAAISDGLASVFFPQRPFVGFLIFAIIGIVGFLALIQFGVGHPSNKPFYTLESAISFGRTIGMPTFAVTAVYAIANAVRTPATESGAQPSV